MSQCKRLQPLKGNTQDKGLALELARGLLPGWTLDGLCFLDDEGCSTVAQADSLDKANNMGRDTASCKPQSMHLCRLDAIQLFGR